MVLFSWKNWLRQADRRRGRRARPAERFRPRLERLESRSLPSFTFGGNFAAGSAPFSVAVADVNGDGKPDLVVANQFSDSVSVLLGKGDGTFQNAQNFAAGSRPLSVAVADVNGDGKPDLVVANSGSDSVSVLLGNRNAATHFELTASARTTAGIAFPLTVRALTPTNQVDWLYGGTVHFSSSDAQATLPADTSFALTDGGARGFAAVVLRTAGDQTITATDTVTGSVMGSVLVTVTPAAADHLAFTVPVNLMAGVPFDILVTVQDAFNNMATGYLGTLDFTLSPGGDLGNYTFTATDQGQHTLAGLVLDAGNYMLAGSDVANPAISGTVSFTVNPPGAPPPGRSGKSPAPWATPTRPASPADNLWAALSAGQDPLEPGCWHRIVRWSVQSTWYNWDGGPARMASR